MDFEMWWTYYRSLKKLHAGNPGNKAEGRTAWDKLKHSEAQYQTVYDRTQALATYDLDRLMKGEDPSRWPHAVRFLNPKKGYIEREIDTPGIVPRETRICAETSCNNATIGPMIEHCDFHRTDQSQELRKKWAVENGLTRQAGESRGDWIQRLRQSAKRSWVNVGG